jgi:hypothetical protein
MFISKKRYFDNLNSNYDKGYLRGQAVILDLIRDSEKVLIVHGNFSLSPNSSLGNSSVFVVPKNIGVHIGKNAKDVTLSGNFITHKPSG